MKLKTDGALQPQLKRASKKSPHLILECMNYLKVRKVYGQKLLRGPTNSNDDVMVAYDVIVTNFPPKYWRGRYLPAQNHFIVAFKGHNVE